MTPDSSLGALSRPLANAINDAFGSVVKFQLAFDEAGRKLFGSGWVWLVKSSDNQEKLQILTTCGHDTPISQGYRPLLVNDIWEHAYYLKHQYQRTNYFRNWWSVVNWEEVSRRFEHSTDTAEYHAEMIASGNLEVFG
jgi:Fe-Mn family superoxide dismutase